MQSVSMTPSFWGFFSSHLEATVSSHVDQPWSYQRLQVAPWSLCIHQGPFLADRFQPIRARVPPLLPESPPPFLCYRFWAIRPPLVPDPCLPGLSAWPLACSRSASAQEPPALAIPTAAFLGPECASPADAVSASNARSSSSSSWSRSLRWRQVSPLSLLGTESANLIGRVGPARGVLCRNRISNCLKESWRVSAYASAKGRLIARG
jgi:hypothetical protein